MSEAGDESENRIAQLPSLNSEQQREFESRLEWTADEYELLRFPGEDEYGPLMFPSEAETDDWVRLMELAPLLVEHGRPADAIVAYQELLANLEDEFGPAHPAVANVQAELAALTHQTGPDANKSLPAKFTEPEPDAPTMTSADPWAVVRAAGADDALIAKLIAKGVTPAQAEDALNDDSAVEDAPSRSGTSEKRGPDEDDRTSVNTAKARIVSDDVDLKSAATSPVSTPASLELLDRMVGLDRVKSEIRQMVAITQIQMERVAAGLPRRSSLHHMVFVGNPGTGKTTVARLVAQIMKDLGVLSEGQLIEVARSDLVGGFLGETAIKTASVFERAIGGVLFIDEAYSLAPEADYHDQYGTEAIDTLVKLMEDHREDLVVIAAGYPAPMHRFLDANAGLRSRFETTIHFDDYTDDQLLQLLVQLANQAGYELTDGARVAVSQVIRYRSSKYDADNGRFCRRIVDRAAARQAERLISVPHRGLAELVTLEAVDIDSVIDRSTRVPATRSPALQELDSLIGLSRVKSELHDVINTTQVNLLRLERDLPVVAQSHHMVFVGNPGTGKTTVARLVAQIMKDLGVLSEGQLIEVARSDLVGGFLGQTAIKTASVLERAIGGVLFIDEAYSLAPEADYHDQYGTEAIDTLVKLMEDHREDLVVIAAGYPAPMHRFLDANPGLRSRFDTTIHFDDYTDDQLFDILDKLIGAHGLRLTDEAQEAARIAIASMTATAGFGNARSIRQFLQKLIRRQANRLASVAGHTDAALGELTTDDVVGASQST